MNDRFKFRAKLKNIDNWVYGAYLKMLPYQPNPVGHRKPLETEYKHLIITEGSADWGMPREIAAYEVISETVGQCTGLKDRNGKLIYEGDIVEFTHTTNIKCIGVIKFLKEDAMFVVVYKHPESNKKDWDFMSKFTLNVIGNIYTTPELLEDENENKL